MFKRASTARISPTALYTAQVWQANQRSVPELDSWASRAMYSALWPAMRASQWFGGPTLTDFLLARHDLIDYFLTEQIEAGRITHVVEIAAGLSPRGCRFIDRYGDAITYIEADLPEMAAQKRSLLENRLRVGNHHQVVDIDALKQDGADSLSGVLQTFPPSKGVAIITEGLLNYFDRTMVEQLWRRIATVLHRYPGSMYLSDLHFERHNDDLLSQIFANALSFFVRGKVHLHFKDEDDLATVTKSLKLDCEVIHPRHFGNEIESCAVKGAGLVRVVRMQASQE